MGKIDTGGVARVYHPCAAPVRAMSYTDPTLLWEMRRWVAALRSSGKVHADLAVEWREESAVGVLHGDGGLIAEVHPSDFLVHSRDGLAVLAAEDFWRSYQERR
ncbi:hypothetical protein [Actinokineospora pegani]|uniref:hypothetical protein n=1 Tax=Actinokineospora pegani TaxID=2654637 RepID=UPI0012EABB84|nr:hypothetical protein [Actinokineospora pegani]